MNVSSLLHQVYADYESDPLLRQGIEFCCRQFYILHRKPFIMQLFASVAPLLEFTVRLLSTRILKHCASLMHTYLFVFIFLKLLLSSSPISDQHQYWSV